MGGRQEAKKRREDHNERCRKGRKVGNQATEMQAQIPNKEDTRERMREET